MSGWTPALPPAQLGWLGRSFAVTSYLPSVVVVGIVALMHSSAASSGHPDWSRGLHLLTGVTGRNGIALGVVALVFSLILHPLQSVFVGVLEGHWGYRGASLRWATHGAMTQLARKKRIERGSDADLTAVADLPAGHPKRVGAVQGVGQAQLHLDGYPSRADDVLPTRLGNVLQRYHLEAGLPYGLHVGRLVPLLRLVAAEREVALLDDRQIQLDLVVRLVVMSLLTTVVTAGYLWRAGLWLLLAAVPYLAAIVLYRGAVAVAAEYGATLAAVMHLNRHALYERLGLPAVSDLEQERHRNATLMLLLRNDIPATYRQSIRMDHSDRPGRRRRRP